MYAGLVDCWYNLYCVGGDVKPCSINAGSVTCTAYRALIVVVGLKQILLQKLKHLLAQLHWYHSIGFS